MSLPDGISGSFYVIVKADYTDTVNEFLLEGDNETATENPITIALADYPDLKIEDFNLTGPDGSQTYTVSWKTFNRGAASAPAGFKDRIRVRNQTTATTVFDQTYTNGALALNASVSPPNHIPGHHAGDLSRRGNHGFGPADLRIRRRESRERRGKHGHHDV